MAKRPTPLEPVDPSGVSDRMVDLVDFVNGDAIASNIRRSSSAQDLPPPDLPEYDGDPASILLGGVPSRPVDEDSMSSVPIEVAAGISPNPNPEFTPIVRMREPGEVPPLSLQDTAARYYDMSVQLDIAIQDRLDRGETEVTKLERSAVDRLKYWAGDINAHLEAQRSHYRIPEPAEGWTDLDDVEVADVGQWVGQGGKLMVYTAGTRRWDARPAGRPSEAVKVPNILREFSIAKLGADASDEQIAARGTVELRRAEVRYDEVFAKVLQQERVAKRKAIGETGGIAYVSWDKFWKDREEVYYRDLETANKLGLPAPKMEKYRRQADRLFALENALWGVDAVDKRARDKTLDQMRVEGFFTYQLDGSWPPDIARVIDPETGNTREAPMMVEPYYLTNPKELARLNARYAPGVSGMMRYMYDHPAEAALAVERMSKTLWEEAPITEDNVPNFLEYNKDDGTFKSVMKGVYNLPPSMLRFFANIPTFAAYLGLETGGAAFQVAAAPFAPQTQLERAAEINLNKLTGAARGVLGVFDPGKSWQERREMLAEDPIGAVVVPVMVAWRVASKAKSGYKTANRWAKDMRARYFGGRQSTNLQYPPVIYDSSVASTRILDEYVKTHPDAGKWAAAGKASAEAWAIADPVKRAQALNTILDQHVKGQNLTVSMKQVAGALSEDARAYMDGVNNRFAGAAAARGMVEAQFSNLMAGMKDGSISEVRNSSGTIVGFALAPGAPKTVRVKGAAFTGPSAAPMITPPPPGAPAPTAPAAPPTAAGAAAPSVQAPPIILPPSSIMPDGAPAADYTLDTAAQFSQLPIFDRDWNMIGFTKPFAGLSPEASDATAIELDNKISMIDTAIDGLNSQVDKVRSGTLQGDEKQILKALQQAHTEKAALMQSRDMLEAAKGQEPPPEAPEGAPEAAEPPGKAPEKPQRVSEEPAKAEAPPEVPEEAEKAPAKAEPEARATVGKRIRELAKEETELSPEDVEFLQKVVTDKPGTTLATRAERVLSKKVPEVVEEAAIEPAPPVEVEPTEVPTPPREKARQLRAEKGIPEPVVDRAAPTVEIPVSKTAPTQAIEVPPEPALPVGATSGGIEVLESSIDQWDRKMYRSGSMAGVEGPRGHTWMSPDPDYVQGYADVSGDPVEEYTVEDPGRVAVIDAENPDHVAWVVQLAEEATGKTGADLDLWISEQEWATVDDGVELFDLLQAAVPSIKDLGFDSILAKNSFDVAKRAGAYDNFIVLSDRVKVSKPTVYEESGTDDGGGVYDEVEHILTPPGRVSDELRALTRLAGDNYKKTRSLESVSGAKARAGAAREIEEIHNRQREAVDKFEKTLGRELTTAERNTLESPYSASKLPVVHTAEGAAEAARIAEEKLEASRREFAASSIPAPVEPPPAEPPVPTADLEARLAEIRTERAALDKREKKAVGMFNRYKEYLAADKPPPHTEERYQKYLGQINEISRERTVLDREADKITDQLLAGEAPAPKPSVSPVAPTPTPKVTNTKTVSPAEFIAQLDAAPDAPKRVDLMESLGRGINQRKDVPKSKRSDVLWDVVRDTTSHRTPQEIRAMRDEVSSRKNLVKKSSPERKLLNELFDALDATADDVEISGPPIAPPPKLPPGEAGEAARTLAKQEAALGMAEQLPPGEASQKLVDRLRNFVKKSRERAQQMGYKPPPPPVGLSTYKTGPGGVPPEVPVEKAKGGSKIVEAFFKRSPAMGALSKTRRGLRRAYDAFMRSFVYGWDQRDFPEFVEDTRVLEATVRRSPRLAIESVSGVTSPIQNSGDAVVFERLVILNDLLETAMEGKQLPEPADPVWRSLNPKDVRPLDVNDVMKEIDRLTRIATPAVNEAMVAHHRLVGQLADHLVERGIMNPADRRQAYFPHMVMKYLSGLSPYAPSTVRVPKRGYLEAREGSSEPILTDYVGGMVGHVSAVLSHNAIEDFIGDTVVKYEDASKFDQKTGWPEEGWSVWDPRRGLVRRADSSAEKLMFDAMALAVNKGVFKDLLPPGEASAVEGVASIEKGTQFVIPTPIAEKLQHFRHRSEPDGWLLANRATSWFKTMVLNPLVIGIPWEITNLTGDVLNLYRDYGLRGLKKLPEGMRRAWRAHISGKNMDMTDEMAESLGVTFSGLHMHDLVDVLGDPRFADFRQHSSMLGRMLQTPKTLMKWWQQLREFRESGPRLSAFISDLAKNVDPRKAAKGAREFTVDYGRATQFEQKYLRGALFPFYMFFAKNAYNWTKYAFKHPVDFSARFVAPRMMADLYNSRFYKDDEDNASPWVRENFHIWTPIKYRGKRVCIIIQTPLNAAQRINPLLQVPVTIGRQAAGLDTRGSDDIARDMVKSPFLEVASLLNPFMKLPIEVATGKSFWSWRDIRPEETTSHVLETMLPPVRTYERVERLIDEPDLDPWLKWLRSPWGLGSIFYIQDPDRARRSRGFRLEKDIRNLKHEVQSITYNRRLSVKSKEQKIEALYDRMRERMRLYEAGEK